jgi:hypothetical protein
MRNFDVKLRDIHSIFDLFSDYFIFFKNFIIIDIKGMKTVLL